MIEEAAAKTSELAESIENASARLRKFIMRTPLLLNRNLSKRYNCNVYLKREDLQIVRSYKLRGAYNMISGLSEEQKQRGVVCASAGNHAQGFAYSCNQLNIKGVVFMPNITPSQKVRQTRMFGESNIEIRLVGDTYDDCAARALQYSKENDKVFVPPFDHEDIIEGQGTVAVEILEDLANIDYVFLPVGGGGLASGVGTYLKAKIPSVKIIGAEPAGAASMLAAFKAGGPVTLKQIDSFVDGAAVKTAGIITYQKCKKFIDGLQPVPEGKVCSTILQLYNEEAIVLEPAAALSVSALDYYKEEIKGKNVVCIITGSNNDIDRLQEIKERSLQYEGLKHYFLIKFSQRPGALKEFVNHVLGPTDDITRFEYMHKHNKEKGPALVGIELQQKEDYQALIFNLKRYNIQYTELNKDATLFEYLI